MRAHTRTAGRHADGHCPRITAHLEAIRLGGYREAVHYWKLGTQLFRPLAVKGRLAHEEEAAQGC